ncbi:MAG: HesA/MoeB/ThiF family protein [Bacteroidetes bacterium]|nr:HesA/MoeB/ThiF family protein [Bacteroidota bacterium]
MERYTRQIALPEIGTQGQQKLASARVLVIGAGGLGVAVLQQLAAAGIGHLGMVDGDVVSMSNLHRQLMYTPHDCGQTKVSVAERFIQNQNPEISTKVFNDYFSESNAFSIAFGYDVLVDCTDSILARYLINDVALALNRPWVYASVHAWQGQLSVFNYQAGPTYRCLFPEPEDITQQINCDASGTVVTVPQLLGTLQANEVIKIILNQAEVLFGKLLLADLKSVQFQTIAFEKNPLQIQKGLLRGLELRRKHQPQVKNIEPSRFLGLLNHADYCLIDLREPQHEALVHGTSVKNWPLNELSAQLESLDKNQKIILFCPHGNQSRLAAEYLLSQGFTQVGHLPGGTASISINA